MIYKAVFITRYVQFSQTLLYNTVLIKIISVKPHMKNLKINKERRLRKMQIRVPTHFLINFFPNIGSKKNLLIISSKKLVRNFYGINFHEIESNRLKLSLQCLLTFFCCKILLCFMKKHHIFAVLLLTAKVAISPDFTVKI